jgi:hypothetical protein
MNRFFSRRPNEWRLPHFLIVGAMKAGTTTLYRDLCRLPEVFMPEQKEPETLVRFDNLDQIRADYHDLFPRASAGKLRGEASTAYTKRPEFEGAAERAFALTGGDLKIVYIRRDPIERIVSHFRHDAQLGIIRGSFSEALRHHAGLIEFSRYDWQIAPWKELFGEEAVLEIHLDGLACDREGTVRRVLSHIGADPEKLPRLSGSRIENEAGDKSVLGDSLLGDMVYSRFYQRRIKPLVPQRWRVAIRRGMFSAPEEVAVDVSAEDRAYIVKRLNR